MHIRDPIHGAIEINADERALLDSPQYQRLRNVKQLGFADLAFPGATHTRYAHGLGAMSVATRVFDALAPKLGLAEPDSARLRQTLRLAVLFHDLGHAPLSHATERIMPPAADLRVPDWTQPDDRRSAGRQACHEDYTLKLVLDSGLAAEISRRLSPLGIEPSHVAALICGRAPPGGNPFRAGRRDLLPIFRQIVSGELDADRMDYLQRDSFFTGVNYGKFDLDWIVQNLESVEQGGRVYLALQHRAVFAFEDFLLSRYHMFLSVYFHYASVGYEQLLHRYCDTSGGEYRLPADPDEFLQHDDVTLLAALRASDNPWAKRIVRRQGYRLLVEIGPFLEAKPGDDHLEEQRAALDEAGIDAFTTRSRGVLSTYNRDATLWVRSPRGEVPIREYTPLYERYAEAATLARLYVPPERFEEAKTLLGV
jgi:HD superfamily phosphohydrolase